MTFASGKFIVPILGLFSLVTWLTVAYLSEIPAKLTSESESQQTDSKPLRSAYQSLDQPASERPEVSLETFEVAPLKTAEVGFDTSTRLLDKGASPDFTKKLNSPYGFAISPDGQQIIWTSSGDESFKRASTDGANVKEINSSFESPYAIVIENSFGADTFYYAEGAIRKRSVDRQLGTESDRVIAQVDNVIVHGLGYDETSRIFYVGDQFGQVRLLLSLAEDEDKIIKTQLIGTK